MIGARLLVAAALVALAGSSCSEQIQSVDPVSTSTSTVPPSSTVPPTSTTTTTTTTSTTSTTTTSTTTTTTTTLPPEPTTTSCEQIVHIGDSTSVPLFSATGVGGAELTADAQYRAVGVDVVYPDSFDARAIVNSPDGVIDALDVAQGVRDNDFDGCWVLMVGTNDAADISAGSGTTAEQRIREMMSVIGDDPVLWVDTVSLRTDDDWRNASMLAWNQELYRVVAEYPNARVFKWYGVVRPQWFRNDGLHYSVEGSAQRAALTAQALVDVFPEQQG